MSGCELSAVCAALIGERICAVALCQGLLLMLLLASAGVSQRRRFLAVSLRERDGRGWECTQASAAHPEVALAAPTDTDGGRPAVSRRVRAAERRKRPSEERRGTVPAGAVFGNPQRGAWRGCTG